jgi:hypothetical protein
MKDVAVHFFLVADQINNDDPSIPSLRPDFLASTVTKKSSQPLQCIWCMDLLDAYGEGLYISYLPSFCALFLITHNSDDNQSDSDNDSQKWRPNLKHSYSG